jgi:hypothetical protein
MKLTIKTITQLAVCVALTIGFTAQAEDKKIDLNGTWKSSFTNQNGQVRESVYKFKTEAGKLTGTVSGRNGDTAIEDAKITGEEISFSVTREFNGNRMVIKYTGKVSGDTIKGKSESQRDGQTQSRDWEAKREKAATKEATKAADAAK